MTEEVKKMLEYITPVIDVFSMDDIELPAGLSSLVVGTSYCQSAADLNDPKCENTKSTDTTCLNGKAASPIKPDCTPGNSGTTTCLYGTK